MCLKVQDSAAPHRKALTNKTNTYIKLAYVDVHEHTSTPTHLQGSRPTSQFKSVGFPTVQILLQLREEQV